MDTGFGVLHVRQVKQQVLEEVLASMTQASEQPSAPRAQTRSASIDGHDAALKELRARTKLSQSDFAALLGVELSTLRNWEQGRRVPTGPARALLRAIRNDPQNVIRALARAA